MPKGKILVIKDEPDSLLKNFIDQSEYEVIVSKSGDDAAQKIKIFSPDLILKDVAGEDKKDGIEEALKIQIALDIPVIFVNSDKAASEQGKDKQSFGYLVKPFSRMELENEIDLALNNYKVDKEIKRLEEELQRQKNELDERVKELNFFYGLSEIARNYSLSLEEILQSIVELIPPAMQYPEVTFARISLDDCEYLSNVQILNSSDHMLWNYLSDIIVSGEKAGELSVCYPKKNFSQLLEEEKLMISAIAERIGKIVERRRAEKENEKLISELKTALANVKTLNGLIPMCSRCKNIRDDSGYWNRVEDYIETHSDAKFSHSLCKKCADELYGDQDWYKKE